MKKIKVIKISCCELEEGQETMLYESGDEFETTGLDKKFRKQYYGMMACFDEDFHGIVLDNIGKFSFVSAFIDKIETL